MNQNSNRKKRMILARYHNRKKQALARAQLAVTAAAGSAQVMHMNSQPMHKQFATGGKILQDAPAGSIVARHWPLPGEPARIRALDPAAAKWHRMLKSMALARLISDQATQMTAAIQKLAKTAQEWTTASSRARHPFSKNHHRICRNHRPK